MSIITALIICAVPLYGATGATGAAGASASPADSSRNAIAQDRPSRLGYSAEARGSHMINVLDIYDELITGHEFITPAITLSFDTLPSDSCYWARAFNFPRFYTGFSWSPYHTLGSRDGCSLGDMYNLFGGALFRVAKNGHFSTGPFFELGLSYATNIYDPVTNPRNLYVGGHLDGMASLGWTFSWLFARHYEASLGVGFTHHSAGRVVQPNLGVNEAGVSLGLRYLIDEPYAGDSNSTPEISPQYENGLKWYVYTACGLHSCRTLWLADGKCERIEPCVRAILGTDAVWRYHPLFSSGIGLHMQYTSGLERLRRADAILYPDCTYAGYSPVQLGADLMQQVHYRGFSAHLRIGAYLFKQQGIGEDDFTGRLYQRLGFRYEFRTFPVFLGLDMKTIHFNTADCLELSVGVRLGK